MGAILRVILVAAVFQSVIFVSLLFFFKAKRREKLEAEWATKDRSVPVEAFVKAGLDAYDGPLKRKLIWAAYVIPSTALALLVMLTSD